MRMHGLQTPAVTFTVNLRQCSIRIK